MKEKLIIKYNEHLPFEELVNILDKTGQGFLAFVNDNEELVGIITDGDIRRAIINKVTVLDRIINKDPIKVAENFDQKKVINQLRMLHRRHMPIINKKNQLIDIITLDDYEYNFKPNYVVIMAGGLGSRLGDLTKATPKPMLKVNDKPILERIVNNFLKHKFNNFVFCVNYKSEIIENYFKDGSEFGINIKYVKESKRLGTAGALSLINFDLEDDFIVANGDVITDLDYSGLLKFHKENNSPATMCIKRFTYQIPYAIVQKDDKKNLIGLKEKPDYHYHINTGTYVLSKEILNRIPKDTFYDMPSLFEELMDSKNPPKTFEMGEYWLDIGQPKDYKKAQDEIN
ncbi:nucleotidyltransferase family protein [Aquimarina mytili]|uniref:Nucleotidyltransferase family protein n=1 Tax=Aquimarina mytili TaxID=874423 RepID=A0A937DBJ2_9FLAO|nr:nucleotidyltransferase family protein [Aquimarina mytili]MBL0684673.1 nucleotidyltransferase family protein [Aquimarina mytili]